MRQLFSLEGKRALITGASSGIGYHFAKVLARAGADVILTARREQRLKENCQAIMAESSVEASYYSFDIGQPEQVKQFLQQLRDKNPVVDILVNCAGTTIREKFDEQSIESWQGVVSINLNGSWQMAHGIAQQMRDNKIVGNIINISSVASFRNVSMSATVYATTKAAVNQMTRHMGLVLSEYNIRVNAIAPGWFDSEMTSEFLKTPTGKRLAEQAPMKRIGHLEELDGPLLLLASDAGSYMTGTILNVDGGYACNGIA